LGFIFNTIALKIENLVNEKINKQNNNTIENVSDNKKIWFTVPFIKSISENFTSITNGVISSLFSV